MLGEGREGLNEGAESRVREHAGTNRGPEDIHSQVVWPIHCDLRGDWGRLIEHYYQNLQNMTSVNLEPPRSLECGYWVDSSLVPFSFC